MALGEPVTLVIYRPQSWPERSAVDALIAQLRPYTTGMALGDEMSVLDAIENHHELPEHVVPEAREKVKELPPPSMTFGTAQYGDMRHG